MRTLRKWVRRAGTVTAVVLASAGVAWAAGLGNEKPQVDPAPGNARFSVVSRAELRDADIEFWAARAARDSLGAEDRAQLAALYLERAGTGGGYADHLLAERTARASLAIRRVRNGKAAALLANALLAQHRFAEAYVVAAELDSVEPGVQAYRALRGEIALEVGRYAEADSLFRLVRRQGGHTPTVTARLARWRELSGDPEAAERLLGESLRLVADAANARPGDGAWFRLRLADLAMRRGDVARAVLHLDEGRDESPDDVRLLDARARAALLGGDWNEAITLGERSLAVVPEPDMLALVSDAYAGKGDETRARETAREMRRLALSDTGPWHRSWTLFLLDHRMEVPAMLARATDELATRRDAYGYGVYAWALHVSGDDQRALAAARSSLGRGLRDAELYHRAGTIALAAGSEREAARYEAEGRRINPSFRPRW